MTLLSLRTGRLAVDLAPSAGGSIARFTVDGADVLRPMTPQDAASGKGNNASAFPLVPFSNRIADGRLVFDGWDGRATVAWPRQRLRLELVASEPFRHAVIYVPPGRPYFCVEPVSHANGKVGEALLAPGATLAGEISFHLSDL
jgi:galactose mutarotase-like enzyme